MCKLKLLTHPFPLLRRGINSENINSK